MKERNKLEGELIEAGFNPIGVCPKRMYKITNGRAMVYELIPQHYKLVYDGIEDPIKKWIRKNYARKERE